LPDRSNLWWALSQTVNGGAGLTDLAVIDGTYNDLKDETGFNGKLRPGPRPSALMEKTF